MPTPLLETRHSRPADHARCRVMLREGSKSFHAAAQLLPDRLRQAATVVYAFCRLADDGVDHAVDGRGALERLHERLDRAYAGDPLDQPVDRALADTVVQHSIPKVTFEWLFDGFAWDTQGRDYETLSDVRAYGVRVAGTVGVMMAVLMGVRDRAALARACDLGIAMQLTNIARDVGEDANAGRLYLPRTWFDEAGLDVDAWLARPTMGPGLASVVERLLAEADRLYARAEPGIDALPKDCRSSIYAARYIYADIGRVIRDQGCDSISSRAVVTGRRKLALITRAGLAARRPQPASDALCLPEAEPFIDAVVATPPTPESQQVIDDNLGWVLTLFDRQARHERLRQQRR
ncbi:hypothetical protein CCR85_07815 [Rhodothalassium salexigens]|uniref:phytoene/squalene synthase family protein n=1 Tax=Rhodothalassium salexigens TaxID=1086 RepID=UPI001912C1BF|nr:phytoene/squalene synthase family protein [Rhodothalassium salexigens]MBK5911399.1 hypothetical protein [Rhodothalassium salexigens]MBK5920226.1 hypothetical protein [Rhodothalassium salexigens]